MFHLHQNGNLVNKPPVNPRNLIDCIVIYAFSERLCNDIDALVIDLLHTPLQRLPVKR